MQKTSFHDVLSGTSGVDIRGTVNYTPTQILLPPGTADNPNGFSLSGHRFGSNSVGWSNYPVGRGQDGVYSSHYVNSEDKNVRWLGWIRPTPSEERRPGSSRRRFLSRRPSYRLAPDWHASFFVGSLHQLGDLVRLRDRPEFQLIELDLDFPVEPFASGQ